MSAQDTIGKLYMSNNVIFADFFNFLIYDGEPVIRPEELSEADAAEIALPYGSNARLPIQKLRDIKKLWAAKQDRAALYVLLGEELQSKIHYAMPVKDMLYDALGFTKQVEEARRSYRKEGTGEFTFDGGTVKIELTSEEFLSGFRKADRLMPIITATVYFGADEWDGPMDLHSMMDVKDERLLRLIPNYSINLIAPARIKDADFEKFNTDLGVAMKVLKYQDNGADRVIRDLNHRKVDRWTAEFINVQAKLGLTFTEPDREGEVDMCKAMETLIKSERADAVAKTTKAVTDTTRLQDIRNLSDTLKLTVEQAMNALKIPPADQPRLAGLLALP